MTFDTLTPNYWASLAVIAVPIVLLTLLGVLVIRLVGRAAERRVATALKLRMLEDTHLELWRLAPSTLVSNEEAVDASVVRADSWSAESDTRTRHGDATQVWRTVPLTYRDLPSFVRQRRRPGESFTEFSRRIGLAE